MWMNVPSLQEALADAALYEFRQPQGKRYELQSVLLLCCVAMMSGAQTEQEIADWSETNGQRWLKWLGIKNERGPSTATITRIFRGIDGGRLEAALLLWSQQALQSLRLSDDEDWDEMVFDLEDSVFTIENTMKRWAAGSELLSALSRHLRSLADRLSPARDSHDGTAHRESLIVGLALTGYVETSDLRKPEHPREAPERISDWPRDLEYIPMPAIPAGLPHQIRI